VASVVEVALPELGLGQRGIPDTLAQVGGVDVLAVEIREDELTLADDPPLVLQRIAHGRQDIDLTLRALCLEPRPLPVPPAFADKNFPPCPIDRLPLQRDLLGWPESGPEGDDEIRPPPTRQCLNKPDLLLEAQRKDLGADVAHLDHPGASVLGEIATLVRHP